MAYVSAENQIEAENLLSKAYPDDWRPCEYVKESPVPTGVLFTGKTMAKLSRQ
jgi:hypothetical protein